MNLSTIIIQLILLIVLLAGSCFGPRMHAQQPGPSNSEQEFLDAIKQGKSEKVNQLLRQKPELIKAKNKNGTTPVLLAVYARHPEIAESLLTTTGIEPNIFEAAATGRAELVKQFVSRNPELVKAYSPDGWTALHLNFGNLEVVKVLLDNGADINAVSKNTLSATPLQGAAAFQKVDLAQLLIARGANVNCHGQEGVTPLHEAAGSGQIEFARLLLDHGANIDAKDDNGKTPLAIALEYKQADMATFLREHKATQ